MNKLMSTVALLALTTQAFADQSLPPQSQNFTYGAPENTQTDSFGRNTAGWLQAPAWGTQNGNRQGYLATPGNADTKGFLNTPGSNMVGDKGFLATPGAVRPGDTTGYLPTPGAQRGQSDTMVATTDDGKTSAVHFMRFTLSEDLIAGFKDGAQLLVGSDHAEYGHIAMITPASRAELAKDFG